MVGQAGYDDGHVTSRWEVARPSSGMLGWVSRWDSAPLARILTALWGEDFPGRG